MSDEVKMTTVPLAGYIRLEQQRDAYREALEQIVAIKGRGRFDGSFYRTNGEQDAVEMVQVARAALGAMSGAIIEAREALAFDQEGADPFDSQARSGQALRE